MHTIFRICFCSLDSPSSSQQTDVYCCAAKTDKSKDNQQQSQHNTHPQRKWPSFTMRRPGRLCSASSSTSATGGASGVPQSGSSSASSNRNSHKYSLLQRQPASDSNVLLRSYSAERHRVNVGSGNGGETGSGSTGCTRAASAVSPHREHHKASDGCIIDAAVSDGATSGIEV